MEKLYKKNWKLYNAIVIVIIILVSIPRMYQMKSFDLDPSWKYAINMFAHSGHKYIKDIFSEPAQGLAAFINSSPQYVFGRDIVFTFGPLGFLICCLNEGKNMQLAAAAWILLLAGHMCMLYHYLFKIKKGEDAKLVAVGMLIYIISRNSGGGEYYLGYIALFSLMLALNGCKRYIYFFDIILMTSLYIKTSLFFMVFGLFAIYLAFGFFHDKKIYKYCSIRMIIGLACSPLIYFFTNGFSLVNFKNYVTGSFQVASGYNVAMSSSQCDKYVVWIIMAVCAFLICVILGIRSGMYNFMVMAFVGECLFMCYKHGVVRSDSGHFSGALSVMLAYLSIILAFLKWDELFEAVGKYKIFYIMLLSFIIIVPIILRGTSALNIIKPIKNKAFALPSIVKSVKEQDTSGISTLPGSILEAIGESSVAIYPWEVSYCISNDLNYVPLAVIQAYSAYTPYLDKISAQKFLGDGAPEYILLSLDIIDDRWPFIECPQTWEAIRNNYHIKLQEKDLFLLKRNADAGDIKYEHIKTLDSELGDTIELGEADFIKIGAQLNIKGKLAKLFWKIPEVKMTAYYADGDSETHRVLLDLFSEGVELGTLAASNEKLTDMLNGTGRLGAVSRITFSGDGLKYYKNIVSVEFYQSLSNFLYTMNRSHTRIRR